MIDILLTIVITLLLLFVAYLIYTQQKEREKLLKMFMAKDLREVTDNEVMERMPKEQEPQPQSDLQSMDDLVDDEEGFDRHVAAVKAQAKEELHKEFEGAPI